MHKLVLFFIICVSFVLAGCRTGTTVFSDDTDLQAKRTADTVREICQYPSYDQSQDTNRYRTIIAAIIINRNNVEQSEEYRSRLIKILTDTNLPVDFSDSITKTIVYGYVPTPTSGSFAHYLHRLIFHLDRRQWFYDPYSNILFRRQSEKSAP